MTSSPRSFVWSEDVIERVAHLHAQGRTATEIQTAINAPTRNSVVGKMNRMGLIVKNVDGPRSQDQAADILRRRIVSKITWVPPVGELEVAQPAKSDHFVGVGAVTIEELRDSHCRWPLDDPQHAETSLRYCGETVVSCVGPRQFHRYCAKHHRLAYRPMKEHEAFA